MEVSRGSGVCAALCIRRTLCRRDDLYNNGHFCCLTVFWLYLTIRTLYQSSKTLKTICVPNVTGLPRLYQQCANNVPIVKNSQKQLKDSQNSKNDHWCTNRYMSTKTVPTVYQSSKTVKRQPKQQKWPLVYQSSHVYQDCTNSVPIVKNSEKQSKDSQNSKNEGLKDWG